MSYGIAERIVSYLCREVKSLASFLRSIVFPSQDSLQGPAPERLFLLASTQGSRLSLLVACQFSGLGPVENVAMLRIGALGVHSWSLVSHSAFRTHHDRPARVCVCGSS